ncbi:lactate dehydrogenase-like 2-hydroxyacid dehydrogenase [Methylorubrum rhodesianum]|uniref:2-hydroxyacid dehydrogenase n=2 Tax=Methylorubrum rhodesianum TaxID=29427 RepID=A0ABU9ZI29_9HYPH|nr:MULTISPECIES: 2-hydroxyacid dehydrogenase [Methylorubrum]MBB5765477.1 lactate dehydrogenase-like 2-hydroxyacid dehydrogenase [Methylorubrum rhodesianum]MBI1691726.1 2-hydroxyacid dehydrogenase [Methylorubrum sp. DB1722]MBK3403882.1 2-hydroxyacid dehydrogenase [Methylorubrum rhodesianum]MBY0143422.1 2-hydroxyacid dehydrogenase [Methylorubrum populi]
MPSQTPEILLIRQTRPDVAGRLAERFRLHRIEEAPDREALLDAVGPRIRALAVGAMCPVDATLFDRLPRLEIVASFGVGYDTIDVTEAARRGIVVTHTPDVLSDEVADLALGLLLATLRRIPQADRYLRAGRWREGSFPLTTSLRERRVGILGLGRIGRAIARRLEGFGVAIAYHGRTPQGDVPYAYHDSLLGLARAVDTLIVAAPGGPGTTGIVDAGVLAALGADGIVVNIARGSVIDEAALIAALQSGTILGAGLDVFENEPQVPQALIDLDQTVLLPHVGSGSHHTRAAMGRLLTDNLFSWFDGGGPVTPVPETPWKGRR